MKISFIKKIAIGFSIVIALLMIMYIFNIAVLTNYSNFEDDYYFIHNFYNNFNDLYHMQVTFLFNFNKNEYLKMEKFIDDLNLEIPTLDKISIYKNDKTINSYIDNFQYNLIFFTKEYQSLFSLLEALGIENISINNQDINLINFCLEGGFYSKLERTINNVDSVVQDLNLLLNVFEKYKRRYEGFRKLYIYLIFGLIFAASIIGVILFILHLKKIFMRLFNYVRDISEKKDYEHIEVREDNELNEMARNIKDITLFEKVLLKIYNASTNLLMVHKNVDENINSLYSSIAQQVSSVQEATQLFNQLTESLKKVAINSKKIKNKTLVTKNRTQKSSNQIRDTIKDIKDLSESASKIMGTVKLINEITEQTEVLSLNAAIEAAKAGSAGRGFAVVATEIRKLSEMSSEATEEISQFTGEIINIIAEVTKKSHLSVEALRIIETNISDVVKVIEDISDATEKESEGSVQITNAVLNVNNLSQQNNVNADTVLSKNEKLKNDVEQLNGLIKEFNFSTKFLPYLE